MRLFEAVLKKIDRLTFPVWVWVGGFVGVVSLRWCIEGVYGLGFDDNLFLPLSSLTHYLLWFGVVFLSASLLIAWFSGSRNILLSLKVLVLLSPTMLLPVPLSYYAGISPRSAASYIFFSGPAEFFPALFRFPFFDGLSIFLRLEVLGSVLGLGFFVYLLSRSWIRSLFATLVSYVLLFCAGSIPSILAWFQGGSSFFYPRAFLFDLFYRQAPFLLIGRGVLSDRSMASFNQWSDLFISLVLFIVLLFVSLFVLRIVYPRYVTLLILNMRPRKGFEFFVTFLLGLAGAAIFSGGVLLMGWINFIALVVVFFLSVLLYGALAYGDDVYDVETDRISHPTRLLARGVVSPNTFLTLSFWFALYALLGATIISSWLVYAIVFSLVCGILYAAPPFRLKRFFLFNTFLVVASFWAFIAAGYLSAFFGRASFHIPWLYVGYGVALSFILVSLKDIPDVDGDRKGKIYTLPVILGVRRAQRLLASLFAIAILIFPPLFQLHNLFITFSSFVFAGVFYLLISRRKYSENLVFLTGVVCVVWCMILLGIT